MNIHKWTSITLIGLVTLSMIGNTERSVLGQQTSSGIGGSATGSVMKSILVKHCVACHGPKKQKANLRLDTLAPDFSGASAETWHDVRFCSLLWGLADASRECRTINRVCTDVAKQEHRVHIGARIAAVSHDCLSAFAILGG